MSLSFEAVLKMVCVFLALAGFLVVGAVALANGEELVWVAAKSVGTFIASWIVFGYFVRLLSAVVPVKKEDEDGKG